MDQANLYRVNLPAFEGPLDLLLYLIRRDELNIYDIPISKITDEYMEFLDVMSELNLDVAGDFLVMAATLTMIKSRMLLPNPDATDAEDADPRAALVERLLEYQRYKQAADSLRQRPVLNRDVFERGKPALALPEEMQSVPPEIGLFDLLDALRTVLGKARSRSFIHQIRAERFSVVDRIHWLHDLVRDRGALDLEELFLRMASRMEIILTFLAMLEMLKARILQLERRIPVDEPEGGGPITQFILREAAPASQLNMDLAGIE